MTPSGEAARKTHFTIIPTLSSRFADFSAIRGSMMSSIEGGPSVMLMA